MKKLIQLLSMMIVLVVIGGLFSACEGPEGPEGPAGKNGVAALATCDNCHDVDTELKARMLQYAASTHALGGNFERSTASCAPCHTHEGFVNVLATGETGDISNPTPPGCRTCHNIHTTYTVDDYALTATAPVELAVGGKTYDAGKSNLCANCHQSRPLTLPEFNDADFEITSSRFGPHHGPQANVIMASGLVEIPGSKDYPTTSNKHAGTGNGCVDCHMAEAYGVQAGGHSMAVAYEYHEETVLNDAGCVDCHDDGATKLEDYKVEMQALMTEISAKLVEKGLMTESGSAVTGTTTGKLASALLNYRTIAIEDKSFGVHNPKYVRALLTNTLESLK